MTYDQLKWLKIGGIAILSILLISAFIMKSKKSDEIDRLVAERDRIHIPEKKVYQERLSHEKVASLEKSLNKKVKEYKLGAIKEGQFNFENKGVRAIYNMMSIPSSKRMMATTPQHIVVNYYKDFDIKFSHISASKATKDEYDVYAVPTITHKGKPVNEHIKFISMRFDEKGNLTGGQLYGSDN